MTVRANVEQSFLALTTFPGVQQRSSTAAEVACMQILTRVWRSIEDAGGQSHWAAEARLCDPAVYPTAAQRSGHRKREQRAKNRRLRVVSRGKTCTRGSEGSEIALAGSVDSGSAARQLVAPNNLMMCQQARASVLGAGGSSVV